MIEKRRETTLGVILMRYMVHSRRDMMVYHTLFEHSLLAGSFKALEHYFWRCGFFVGLRNSSGET